MHYLDILSCLKFKNSPLGPNHGGAFGSHKMYKMSRFHCLKSWNVCERLIYEREPDNQHDQYAVRLVKNGETVWYIPRNVSQAFFALITGGSMYAVVIGKRENKHGTISRKRSTAACSQSTNNCYEKL